MSPLDEPLIETAEVQGNVFPGFNKSHQALLGILVLDVQAAKRWLSSLVNEVCPASEVIVFRRLRSMMMKRSGLDPAGSDLNVVWLNLAFSAAGLRKLCRPEDVDLFEDDAFKLGLYSRSSSLNDPPDAADVQGSPKNWRVGGNAATTPDVLILVGGDDLVRLDGKIASLKSVFEPTSEAGVQLIYEERGNDLPGKLAGHEHFGFKDGISQPGMRGRNAEPPYEYLTPRIIDSTDPQSLTFSAPGQPLVWPGQFIFGYSFQGDQDPTTTARSKDAPAWARNGSFLVFRRLLQDVKAFWDFMAAESDRLAKVPGFDDIKAPELAALLVGRWPSGAPVMRTPLTDDSDYASNPANNNFQFGEAGTKIQFDPNSGVLADYLNLSLADRSGLICPHAGHIRKVNPRDITPEGGATSDVLQRRILRRGIPFGKVTAEDDGKRGLLFVSYQTSIVDQFEFLVSHWINQPDRPESEPGKDQDLLIGQGPNAGRVRKALLRRRVSVDVQETSITTSTDWVIPTGGGYFFAPSISAIREVISV